MKYLLATAAVLALATGVAQAYPTSSAGVPGKPFGGGECTTYPIGGTEWSFKTTDPGNNLLGRVQMVNDAFLGKYSITVKVASELGRSPSLDTVECIDKDGNGVLKATPFGIVPTVTIPAGP